MPQEAIPANKNLVLIAMVFAVAMMFIDQTIVALAIPNLQHDLSLSSTGAQWIVNGYLLSLSALFAFGGKLADVLGHRRMVLIGTVGFAVFSALCGATPTGSIGEAWIITFRVAQGASAAVLFPAALAIVVATFLRERGKALALFFGITGGLTAVGPITGGYLTEWTWRSIFWINVPIAVIAIILTLKARPENSRRVVPIDYRGAVLGSAAMGLVVFGLQQAGVWGWGSAKTWGCIVVGLALLAGFVAFELRQQSPLIQVRIFAQRAFAADNLVLTLMSAVFIPFFFFASVYAQASLGYSTTHAGTLLFVFFGGFAAAAQLGGRLLDSRGAKLPVVVGCAVAAVGFFLWGRELTGLDFSSQWIDVVLAGAGLGLVLGPVSTDALNRAPDASYGEVTGITQTVRNFGSSIGLAVMGSIFATQNVWRVSDTLESKGVPTAEAHRIARSITSAGSNSGDVGQQTGAAAKATFEAVQLDIAHSTQVVVWIMAAIMVVAFAVAQLAMQRGRFEEPVAPDPSAAAGPVIDSTP